MTERSAPRPAKLYALDAPFGLPPAAVRSGLRRRALAAQGPQPGGRAVVDWKMNDWQIDYEQQSVRRRLCGSTWRSAWVWCERKMQRKAPLGWARTLRPRRCAARGANTRWILDIFCTDPSPPASTGKGRKIFGCHAPTDHQRSVSIRLRRAHAGCRCTCARQVTATSRTSDLSYTAAPSRHPITLLLITTSAWRYCVVRNTVPP